MDFETIAQAAEQLGPRERFLLAERLVRDLEPTTEHRQAWLKESARRAQAIESGEMKTMPASEALKQLRKITRG